MFIFEVRMPILIYISVFFLLRKIDFQVADGQSSFNTNKNLIIDATLVGQSSEENFSRQKVRLRGVDRKFAAGRLEIYLNGKWNLVCERFFTQSDADVACSWLGFHNGAKSIWGGSKFGNGLLKQFSSLEFKCNGNETDLLSCPKIQKPIFCDAVTQTVGVECKKNYEFYCRPDEVAFKGYCYKVVRREATFDEANSYCNQSSGALATIIDQEQMDFISELLIVEDQDLDPYSNIYLFFIGGHKLDDSNAWRWISKVPMAATSFSKWKPALTNVHHGKLSDRKFNCGPAAPYCRNIVAKVRVRKKEYAKKSINLSISLSVFFLENDRFQQTAGKNCIALLRNQTNLQNRDYYFWDNVRCTEKLNFICQRKLDFTSKGGCLNPRDKRHFEGSISTTVDGERCAMWNNPDIWRRRLLFRGQTFMNHNFCRNPDNDRMPWCLIDHKKIGYCDVPVCLNPNFPICEKDELQCSLTTNECIPIEFLCDFDKDCPNGMDELNCPDCGKIYKRVTRSIRNEDILEPLPWGKVAKIVGGSETSEGSYPWTVSVRLKETNQHYCGASLIDKFHVLTAAHCFDKDNNTSSYWVILGDWDVSREEPQEKKFEIAEILPHPDYKGLKYDDVALVRLKTDGLGVPFTDYIQPVCLSTKYTAVGKNTKCYVSGWGSNGESVVNRMQAAQIPVISRSQCTQNDVYGSNLSPRSFCAGYLTGGVDACIGDSGGPFACEVNGRYFLVGMVSWGEGCAERNKPGVYTSVKDYVGWIRQKIMKLDLSF